MPEKKLDQVARPEGPKPEAGPEGSTAGGGLDSCGWEGSFRLRMKRRVCR